MKLLKEASNALDNAVRDLPEAKVEFKSLQNGRATATLRIGRQKYHLELLWAGQGWPSEINEATKTVPRPWPRHLAVVAKSLSPGALEILSKANANWLDEAGNAHLVVPPGLAIVKQASRKLPAKDSKGFQWSRSAIEIGEFVLHKKIHQLKTGELAKWIGWSSGQVSQIIGAFEDLEWTERRGGRSGRSTWHELVKPGVMLDSWADKVSRTHYHRRLGHRTHRDLLQFANTELADTLGRQRQDWALTTWAGLQMIAPYATSAPSLHVYVEERRFQKDLDKLMQAVGIREVEEGARIEFWKAEFKLVTQPGEPHGVPIASSPRLYADLLRLGGRASDAAQHLRETVLGY